MDTTNNKKEAVKAYLDYEISHNALQEIIKGKKTLQEVRNNVKETSNINCTMKNISLKEMFDILIDCIMNKKEQYPTFYYKRKNFNTGNPEFAEITEVDLMYGRFKTIDDDFSEFEWELNESHIYIKEDDYNALYI